MKPHLRAIELARVLTVEFPACQFKLRDGAYNCPDIASLMGSFGKWLDAYLAAKGLTYDEDTFDCDDFATMAVNKARESYALDYKGSGASLAIGTMDYRINGDPTQIHEIVLVIAKDGDKFRPVTIETQPPFRIVNLLTVERRGPYIDI